MSRTGGGSERDSNSTAASVLQDGPSFAQHWFGTWIYFSMAQRAFQPMLWISVSIGSARRPFRIFPKSFCLLGLDRESPDRRRIFTCSWSKNSLLIVNGYNALTDIEAHRCSYTWHCDLKIVIYRLT